MTAAIDRLRIGGHPVQDADLTHASPYRYEHINPYGQYTFNVRQELARKGLRPLRKT